MDEGERKNADVAREYRTGEIAVQWRPEYCIHTARCLEALPHVFDVRRRPWISVDAAAADEVAQAVMLCPTGALTFERLDGGAQEQRPAGVTVEPWPNGPLFLRGSVRITDSGGEVAREATRVALCRCGGSDNKPFCDGTHRAIGFQAE
jgi:uncharacterized Fe-S cluster protein YjdI